MKIIYIFFTLSLAVTSPGFAEEGIPEDRKLDLRLPRAVAISGNYDKYDCANSNGVNRTIVIPNGGGYRKPFVVQSYIDSVIQKIERLTNDIYLGNRNFIGQTALVELTIFHTGELREIQINRSSGSRLFDKMIEESVRRISPFPEFPEQMTQVAGCITLTRTWNVK
jgi:TonB family protein